MAKITTAQLIDEYYSKHPTYSRGQIDNVTLHRYEESIGKELLDMNSAEILELILKWTITKTNGGISTNYPKKTSHLRQLFNYYIENYEAIVNPLSDECFSLSNMQRTLLEHTDVFTMENLNALIENIHDDFVAPKADYLELIIRLFLDGFATTDEFIFTPYENYNKEEKSVTVYNSSKKVYLSDRTAELLEWLNSIAALKDWRQTYSLVRYKGSLIKFAVKPGYEDDFENRIQKSITGSITALISKKIGGRYNIKLNYHQIYLLGFYEYLGKRYGKKQRAAILFTERDHYYTQLLHEAAVDYGVPTADLISQLKYSLRPFAGLSEY